MQGTHPVTAQPEGEHRKDNGEQARHPIFGSHVKASRRRWPRPAGGSAQRLRETAEARRDVRRSFESLNAGASGVNIIAEIKRASPSKG